MQLSLSNLSFTGFDYPALSRLPAPLGLELFYEFGDPYHWEQVIKEVFAKRPSCPMSLHGPCVGVNLADEHSSHYLFSYRDIFSFAAAHQISFVVVHTNESYEGIPEEIRRRVIHRLELIMELANDFQVPLAIENVGLKPKNSMLFDWPEYRNLFNHFPAAYALLDTGHAHVNGWNLPEVVTELGDRLIACHLHDNDGSTDSHLPIGLGSIEWSAFFAAVTECAPQTTLVFEYAHISMEKALESIQTVCDQYLK